MSGSSAPTRIAGPLVVLALVLVRVAWPVRRLVARPARLALAGAVPTLAVLLARGPSDWASASTSIKLYSFPTLVMATAIGAIIADLLRHGVGEGRHHVHQANPTREGSRRS